MFSGYGVGASPLSHDHVVLGRKEGRRIYWHYKHLWATAIPNTADARLLQHPIEFLMAIEVRALLEHYSVAHHSNDMLAFTA